MKNFLMGFAVLSLVLSGVMVAPPKANAVLVEACAVAGIVVGGACVAAATVVGTAVAPVGAAGYCCYKMGQGIGTLIKSAQNAPKGGVTLPKNGTPHSK